jgi:ribonuclease VapC
MVIDSSAIVAILRLEPEAERFLSFMDSAEKRLIAAPNLLEIEMVISSNKGGAALDRLDRFIGDNQIDILPFAATHAAAARAAFLRYGKGRHRAGLNFGDCIAYATAKIENMPLLFKGDDFRLTDISPAA